METEKDLAEKTAIVMRQTDYTEEEARTKLIESNLDYIRVIKDFCGIVEKPCQPIKSIQQQIYKEIRFRMDESMKDFNDKQGRKLGEEIEKNNSTV